MIQANPQQSKSQTSLQNAMPEEVAQGYVSEQMQDGVLTLRHWNGMYYRYFQGRYEELTESDVRNDVVKFLHARYSAVRSREVSDIRMNVAALCSVLSFHSPPFFLDGNEQPASQWGPKDTFVTRNCLVNLDMLTSGRDGAIVPATPQYFNFQAADCELDTKVAKPERWLAFLHELWPNEPDSIELLRQWMGYLLTVDTRQQKILLMIGPKRSGKGTIARVMRELYGDRNCCSPTLASLATNFGLSPLLNKSVAIIGDARLSGRTDVSATTERLLSISGEDAQTIDRKHKEPVTTQLPTRFTIISNELPHLKDASGALAGRLLILQLTRSFYGSEDKNLSSDLAKERSGILLWAIGGWKALRDSGSFAQSESGLSLAHQMHCMSSPISEFVHERCVLGDGETEKLDKVYESYEHWCEEAQGMKHIPIKSHFSRDLTAAFPQLKRGRPRDKSRGNEHESRVVWLRGISLRFR